MGICCESEAGAPVKQKEIVKVAKKQPAPQVVAEVAVVDEPHDVLVLVIAVKVDTLIEQAAEQGPIAHFRPDTCGEGNSRIAQDLAGG